MTREISSEAEMIALGEEAAAGITGGDVFALTGRLGAGKTHFAKGIVRGLGGDPDRVTSPTFTLVHEYQETTIPVFHFDFYRIDTAEEVLRIGWDEYVEECGGIVIVEWADKFPELIPDNARRWLFEIAGDGRRVSDS